jgi:hypothetical protein
MPIPTDALSQLLGFDCDRVVSWGLNGVTIFYRTDTGETGQIRESANEPPERSRILDILRREIEAELKAEGQ